MMGDGGQGGGIIIIAQEMSGNGTIDVSGGDGLNGGPAGDINIHVTGKINGNPSFIAKGGKSILNEYLFKLYQEIENNNIENGKQIIEEIKASTNNLQTLGEKISYYLGIFANVAQVSSTAISILQIIGYLPPVC